MAGRWHRYSHLSPFPSSCASRSQVSGEFEVVIWAGGRASHPEGTVPAAGLEDGLRSAAGFNSPRGIAVDNSSNVFVADTLNHVIRWIDPSGYVVPFE